MAGAEQFRVGPDEDPDRYRLERLHSSGAEGEVWRAKLELDGDVVLDVAVKILHAERQELLTEWRERWTEQVELLRSLQYPGVVPVREAFEGPPMHHAGQPAPKGRSLYLVMNWIAGESLHEWVSRRPERDVFDALRLLTQVAGALDYLHSGQATGGKAVVHRDVKPANIIVAGEVAILVDFGLVRALTKGVAFTPGLGTISYMAPEVTAEGAYTPESDRYALGCVAYYMLTGEDPPPDYDLGVMRTRLAKVPALGANASLLNHLMTMLDPNPAARPERATAWVQLFRSSTLTDVGGARGVPPIRPAPAPAADETAALPVASPPRRRAPLVAALVAVLAMVAATVAYAAFRSDPSSDATKFQSAAGTQTSSSAAPTTTVAPSTTAPTLVGTTTVVAVQATTTAPGGGRQPVPNPPTDVLKTLLLTPTDLRPVFGGAIAGYGSTDVPFLSMPATTVCDSVPVATEIVNPVSTAFYFPGYYPAGSMAVSMYDAAGFLVRMREAVAKCKFSIRSGPTLANETFRYYVDKGSSQHYDDYVYVRKGDVIVEVFIRTDSGLHSDLADQMAVIVADRMKSL